MVFYLSAQEQKYLVNRLLPVAREVGVSSELRGWNWWKEPLKPCQQVYISMFSVCGKFCPTARDVYLMYVERKPMKLTREMIIGAMVHNLLEYTFETVRSGDFNLSFEKWWEAELSKRQTLENIEFVRRCFMSLWDLIVSQSKSAYLEARSAHPHATDSQLLAVAIPFLVEHRLDGSLLGLSGTLSVDCYDYLRHIIFDVKVGGSRRDFYRLYPTGYALVFESLYEVPVDIGCSIVINFRDDKVCLDRDLFFIGDDLRSWWIEERDRKQELVSQRRDPGKASECPPNCMFSEVCE